MSLSNMQTAFLNNVATQRLNQLPNLSIYEQLQRQANLGSKTFTPVAVLPQSQENHLKFT